MTEKLRLKTFEAMMSQEMGWFDEETHNSRTLSARLSTDASLVQQAAARVTTRVTSTPFFFCFCLLCHQAVSQ